MRVVVRRVGLGRDMLDDTSKRISFVGEVDWLDVAWGLASLSLCLYALFLYLSL